MDKIFIPGNVASSKNSRVWTGRFFIGSKTTRNYISNTQEYWIKYKKDFQKMFKDCEYPYHIGFYYVRDSKRRFDYANMVQILADLMVKNGWIEDDDALHFVPYFTGFEVDKKNAGVYISRYK